jgi:hypothetical protein
MDETTVAGQCCAGMYWALLVGFGVFSVHQEEWGNLSFCVGLFLLSIFKDC